jgi:RNA polymerase sigma-70 factor (ECF subfamily)
VKTKTRAIDRLRKKQRQMAAAHIREPVAHRDPTTESAFGKLEKEHLRKALNQLPPSQREAITATYLHAMTQQEWSRMTGHPLGTVKSWVRYGLKNIKKNLIQIGWLEPSEGGHAHGPEQM